MSDNILGASNEGVNNILIKLCNANAIYFNSQCQGVVIEQNVVRYGIEGGDAPCVVRNNITGYIDGVIGGSIENNIIYSKESSYSLISYNSIVVNNIILMGDCYVTMELTSNNMGTGRDLGANTLSTGGASWSDIFVDYQEGRAIHLNDWHLKEGVVGKNGGNDGTDVGIYGGRGFNTMGTPPYPRVILKEVPNATDAQGNLKIKVKVVVP